MIIGHVRDNLPRVTLALPGLHGTVNVEFILDTGFNGDLIVPRRVIRELDARRAAELPVVLADGSEHDAPQYQIALDWNEEIRMTEVGVMEGRPLLGNLLLEGCHIDIDMVDGGEVVIEFD